MKAELLTEWVGSLFDKFLYLIFVFGFWDLVFGVDASGKSLGSFELAPLRALWGQWGVRAEKPVSGYKGLSVGGQWDQLQHPENDYQRRQITLEALWYPGGKGEGLFVFAGVALTTDEKTFQKEADYTTQVDLVGERYDKWGEKHYRLLASQGVGWRLGWSEVFTSSIRVRVDERIYEKTSHHIYNQSSTELNIQARPRSSVEASIGAFVGFRL